MLFNETLIELFDTDICYSYEDILGDSLKCL